MICQIRTYIFYYLNRISNYQLEKTRFYHRQGYKLNLKNPQSFQEKIVWKKIYDRNPLLPIVADKYQVRFYLQQVLGEENTKSILVPLLYVTEEPKTIPFEELPDEFIVKPNHASGLNIIIRNGCFNQVEIVNTCLKWLKTPYGLDKLEWAYKSIKRKIVIEKLLIDEDGKVPKEFKFHMFHGKCKLICVVFDRMAEISKSYFDEKFNLLPIKTSSCPPGKKIQRPINYLSMMELAEKLSQPFDYIRVDLYNMNGEIYFGELTNYPTSGMGQYDPRSFDYKLGEYWNIEPGYWKK
ncbi:MAG: hypothetical protein JXC36_05135 [Candidatus Atribacteria bacterium]|nr:hypothetical protein [Candidatus Atribacteria bacterium]